MQASVRFLRVLVSTLGFMWRAPMTTINTILIVAIALLLPSFLYIGVKTTEQLGQNWQGRPQLTLFLQQSVSGGTAQLIYEEVSLNPRVARAQILTPEDALNEFSVLAATAETRLDLSAELEFLGVNPLPYSIVLMPQVEFTQGAALAQLKASFAQIDEVESVKLDLNWVAKFNAITEIVASIALILAVLLGVGLILIIGNTIKLLIMARRQEIELIKLVGGTDRFVRRPFLMFGTLFGLFGSLVTLLLLGVSALTLASPLASLASSYGTTTLFYSPTWQECFALIGLGSLLGWLAARWSVAQHIRRIRPQ